MVDGVATAPFSATALPPIGSRTGSEQKVIAVSRERYAQTRQAIEEKVLRWSGMEAMGAERELAYPIIQTQEEREKGDELGESSVDETSADTGEYLRISPERLEAIAKPKAKKRKTGFFAHVFAMRKNMGNADPTGSDASDVLFRVSSAHARREED